MMKLLRILTGVHAGAELRLTAGAHRIGADDDADIRISDWRGADMLLTVDDSGMVSARSVTPGLETVQSDELALSSGGGGGEAADVAESEVHEHATMERLDVPDTSTVLLVDYVPMQFGDTVICIGWPDTAWPSDLDLLSTLLIKPAQARREAERSRQRKLVGIVLGCAMLGAVIVIGSVLMTTIVSRAALPHDAGDLAQRVNTALAAAHMNELHAQALGSSVAVSGMVASPEDDTAVRKLLARVSSTPVLRHYDIAQNDTRNIEDSLGMQGVHVAYAGHGAFDITGKAANPSDVDTALARIRRDLSDNVKTLRMRVVQSNEGAPLPPSFSELMSSDDVRYAETPDGVKHIYAMPETPASSAAGAAGAAGDDTLASADGASDALPATVKSGAAAGVMQPVGDSGPATPTPLPTK
ncbi:secretion protein [Paraburkholderia fungorum]|uniref:Secretion protein n=1 Tax=Paraburkholderia fungorum TaxID=134537 RepID=A0A420FEQ2_9BURK|nr:secretion protein [Paraburkholderia fungorum]RKF31432.1 secretion protein [Paraburkholderia fungorum]